MKNRLLFKTAALLMVLALLMAGLSMIQDVVRDRFRNRNHAVQSVVASLAGPQTLVGPALVQSCTETTSVPNGRKTEYTTREFQRILLPDTLRHHADANMEERSRGLHRINAYVLHDKLRASFANAGSYLDLPASSSPGAEVRCKSLHIAFALTDPRGMRSAAITANGHALDVEPGTPLERYGKGLQAPIDPKLLVRGQALEIDMKLELVGTESLAFTPLGTDNQVTLTADWPHPSFGGSFLPTRREIGGHGFTASWNLSALASSAQQAFTRQQALCRADRAEPPDDYAAETAAAAGAADAPCLETMDTGFISPVNPYSLSDRASKYGLLFAVLTFVAVGLFEVLQKLRVHPVQYLLVGSALSSFFLLLLGLSEHLGFATAYAVAASACVALLAYYASHMLGSVRRGLPLAAGIAMLYGLLYVLLQLEQTALVVGSIALFAVLALVMVCTRRVDWYAFGATSAQVPAREAA